MYDEIKKLYGFTDWDEPSQEIRSLFVHFVPWQEDCRGWERVSREAYAEEEGHLLRTVWDNPEDTDSRVLISVCETSSLVEAYEALIVMLAHNHVRLPEGPADLGYVSFVHPEGVPPAIYWARENLCLGLYSFGGSWIDNVVDWAFQIDTRLMHKPVVDRLVLKLEPAQASVTVGQEVAIRYSFPWRLGEDGYYKFFATGGELFLRGEELFFRAQEPGEAIIEAFGVETGREPYGGHLTLPVES